MTGLMRHIGKTVNTDRRVVVVFMQIPGREDHALIVDTDALPPKYHDDLMTVVQQEGQSTKNLGELLGRRVMPSTGSTMLETLHAAGALIPMPVDKIIMLPQPNHGILLSELLKHMGQTQAPVDQVEQVTQTEYRDNRIIENQAIDKNNERYQIAMNVLLEAKLLDEEAARKRESAYQIYPALRPKQESAAPAPVAETQVEKTLDKPVAAKRTTKAKKVDS